MAIQTKEQLKFYKMEKDVNEPIFATEGSACFDICTYLCKEGAIYSNKPKPVVTIYQMDNKKVLRDCTTLAGPSSTFITGISLFPGERALIPTGLILDIPENHSVRIHARSSVSLKKGLIIPNGEGIIDSDYYHQTYVMLYNGSADEVRINHGDRIAQGELIENYSYSLEETKDIPEQKTTRVGGFGSTGV